MVAGKRLRRLPRANSFCEFAPGQPGDQNITSGREYLLSPPLLARLPHALTESYEGPCRDDGPHVVLHRKCTGQSLAPEIHRSDVAVLLAGLGGRKWRERAGTPQNIK